MIRLVLIWALAGVAVAALWALTIGRIRRNHRGHHVGPYEAFTSTPGLHMPEKQPWPEQDDDLQRAAEEYLAERNRRRP